MRIERRQETPLGEAVGGRPGLQTGPFGSQLHAADYVPAGVPVVMPRDLRDGSISTRKIARVSAAKASELTRYRVRVGDVLLARRGEMGRCAQVGRSQAGWICGTGCLRIRPGERLDGRFLAQLLRSPLTAGWLADHAVGQTLPSLNTRILSRLPIRLPGLSEQQRIAAALESADQAIRASQVVIDRVAGIRTGTFHHLLTRGPGQGSEGRSHACFAPRNWPRRPISSLCTISSGHAFKTSERSRDGLPIIRIQNLNGSRRFHRFAGRPARRWTVESGDLLFAWAGVKGSSFGPCLWPGPRGVLNQHIFRLSPAKGVVKEWLFEALELVTREIEERAHGFKSNLVHLRKRDLVEHRVAVPPLEVQHWIAARSRALAELAGAERNALESMRKLKRGLARDLLAGPLSAISGCSPPGGPAGDL